MLNKLREIFGFRAEVTEKASPLARPNQSENRVPTIDLFGEEPHLAETASVTIQALTIPWNCDDSIKRQAKDEALRCVLAGCVTSKAFLKTLVPVVFRTQSEAKHGMAKIYVSAIAAVSRAQWAEVGLKKFEWHYLAPICDFPEHAQLHGRKFSATKGHKGEFPASRYGCRCLAMVCFEEDY